MLPPSPSASPVPFPLQTRGASVAATAVRVARHDELPDALLALGLAGPRPTLVLVGGAAGLVDGALTRLRPLFVEAIAPFAEAHAACVVDGGTDAGVMALAGGARAELGATFPLVGVVVEALGAFPAGPPLEGPAARLEPHHTHFVLVPGARWGDESPWIGALAGALAAEGPSGTLPVEGGAIAWNDVAESVAAHRQVVVVAGSGRTADALAERARARCAESSMVTAVDLEDPPALARALAAAFSA